MTTTPRTARGSTEIKGRARRRMGEISKSLEISKGGANPRATLPSTGKSKSAILKSAGISTIKHRIVQYHGMALALTPEMRFERMRWKTSRVTVALVIEGFVKVLLGNAGLTCH